MKRLLIVDGHAYAYRAFHAIRNLRGPEGRPTNAIYGFIKMLEKLRVALEPAGLMVVWDGGLSAERMAALPEYKIHRPEMPEDLRPQLNEIGEYLTAVGVASFCGPGIEADDYIACLARQAAGQGWQVVIASSDKDFMQLVCGNIGLWNPNDKAGMVWTREQVLARSGVEPGQVADWLALMGDAVDNIPGVPGVGPKTAADLLKQFGSVASLYGRLAEVKSEKLRAALTAAAENVRRNLRLVQLHEVACEFMPERLAPQPASREQLRQLFQRWGFKGMIESLDRTASAQQTELI
ncbi:MAG TPA: 5'-3' exonuclease H3TH domain-containing protein [Verrucomicrobiae bacterium]